MMIPSKKDYKITGYFSNMNCKMKMSHLRGKSLIFINQTVDLNPNHQLAAYQAAIDQEIEFSKPPIAPVSDF